MALNDPLGDMNRPHPQCADAQQVQGVIPASRLRVSVLDVLQERRL